MAGTGENVTGWLWSSNIGWVSLNSLNDGQSTGYGVHIAPATGTGNLSGYAWSPHIGWVSFNAGDVSGCPSGTCAPALDWSTGTVTGWARTLAPIANGGGWDGWINLSGVTLDLVTKKFSGFAWGADVVGWLDFSGAAINLPSTLKVCENFCNSTFPRGQGGSTTNFSLAQGTSQDLVACYNPAPDCSDASGDVTTATVWTESDTPNDAIDLSAVAGKERVTAGNSVGTERFTAVYNGNTVTMQASVVCVPINTCTTGSRSNQVCTGATFTISDDGCGNPVTCQGTRYCDYNWKEVAP